MCDLAAANRVAQDVENHLDDLSHQYDGQCVISYFDNEDTITRHAVKNRRRAEKFVARLTDRQQGNAIISDFTDMKLTLIL